MRNLSYINRIIISGGLSFVMFLSASCTNEVTEAVGPLPAEGGERVEISVDFSDTSVNASQTKGSLLNGVETVHSGAVIYAFIIRDGVAQIDNYAVVSGEQVSAPGHEATSDPVKMKLISGAVYDFYVVGNCWYIDKNTGLKTDWFTAMDADMPADYDSGLKNAEYRFDGSDFRSVYRHEKFSEVKTYGIPYSGSKTGVQINSTGQSVSIENCRYLFAKVTFTVDHSGLDGGLDDGYFKNRKVYLRQANPSIHPFAEKNVLSGTSIDADCDESMGNGHCETYTLYVPENCQGTLLSTEDPALKSGDNEALAQVRDKLTYIEFHGTVNPSNAYASQIGYSGDATYQFYLGSDNCRNFDIIGGRNYHVTMGFTVDNLFNPSPLWRVTTSNFSDSRLIDVTKDASFTQPLGTTFVGLRKSRGNSIYVYVNKEGASAGTNAIVGKPMVTDPSAFHAEDVTDCAISMSPSPASLLSKYGIAAEYKAETGAVSFAVSNAAKFEAFRTGAGQVDVTLTLLPSKEGQERTRTFTVKALEELELVVPDKDIYIGQKAEIMSKGFLGTPKLSSNVGTVFRTTNAAGSDNYLSGTPVGFTDGRIDLYAYNYNNGNAVTLTLTSDDTFNDGSVSKTVTVKKPKLATWKGEVHLGIDGTERELEVGYYYESGSLVKFEVSDFDEQVYAQVLAPAFSVDAGYKDYVGFDGSKAFFKKMPADKTTSDKQFEGKIYVKGKNTELFPEPDWGPKSIYITYRYPQWVSQFSDITDCNIFNINSKEAADDRKVETTARIDLAYCSSPFTPSNQSEWYEVKVGNDYGALTNGVDKDNGRVNLYTVKPDDGETAMVYWYIKPQISGNNIDSPWGSRTVTPLFVNKHDTSQRHSLNMSSFEVKYAPITLNRLCLYPVNDAQRKYNNADCFICCNLAAVLYEFKVSGKNIMGPPSIFELTSLPVRGQQYDDGNYQNPVDVPGTHSYIYLRYAAWSLRGWNGIQWTGSEPMGPEYNGIYWYDAMADEAIRTGAGQIYGCYFLYEDGTKTQTLQSKSYLGDFYEQQRMQSYIPIIIESVTTVRTIKY